MDNKLTAKKTNKPPIPPSLDKALQSTRALSPPNKPFPISYL